MKKKCPVTILPEDVCPECLPIYIQVRKGKLDRTVELGNTCFADLDEDGKVLGIELFQRIYNEGKVKKVLETLP